METPYLDEITGKDRDPRQSGPITSPGDPEYTQHVALVRLRNAERRKFNAEAASFVALTILFLTGSAAILLIVYYVLEFAP